MTQLFRITHIDNLPFILEHGLHCSSSTIQDAGFKPIGYPSLIEYRNERVVPIEPNGSLNDYIPFYFWYRSPMLFVVYKGNDPEVIKTNQKDIVYLVSSLESLQQHNCQFVFTDRHAKLEYANFYNNSNDVDKLNWEKIKTEQWGRQFGAETKEMKQAECLVYQHIPIQAIIGIAVLNEGSYTKVREYLSNKGLNIPLKIKPNFYF